MLRSLVGSEMSIKDIYHGLGEMEFGYGDKYMVEFENASFNGRGTFKLVISISFEKR